MRALLLSSLFAALAAALTSADRTPTAVVDVLAYNDVYELLQDDVNGHKLGGPSRVIPLVKAMREKNPNSLVLFAGDTMSPSLWSSQFKGLQMIDAHNALGVDAACLGNHEFDFGIEGFLNVTAKSNFPWLNANCYETATGALLRGTTKYLVKTLSDPRFGTITIGFFGVMYDMKAPTKGLYWSDPIEAAAQMATFLREKKRVDFVIALTHQDLADDNRLSKEVQGIDLIYAGHDHASMLQTNFGTPFLKADFDFRSVWSSHIEWFAPNATANQLATTRMSHQAIPITEEMPSDANLDATINDYAAKIGQLFERQVGSLCESLDLSERLVRSEDVPIGHIFADAGRTFYGPGSADVAIMNGGGIRTDTVYPAGPLTLGQLVAWSPFGNSLMIIEIDGAALKAFVTKEMVGSCGAGGLKTPNGFYVHPSGFQYEFHCTGSGAGEVTKLEWMDHPTRTGPVGDSETLKLALSDFLFASEFNSIPDAKSKVIVSEAEATRIDAALEEYAKAQPDAAICAKGPKRSLVTM